MPAKPSAGRVFEVKLPYPPTVNSYYKQGRTWSGKRNTRISTEGRRFRHLVREAVGKVGAPGFEGPLEVRIAVFFPDRYRRDLDNLQKATLDALEKARVFKDDSQVANLQIFKLGVHREDPQLLVIVREIDFALREFKGPITPGEALRG